jgi:hypothetical protein
MNTRKIFGGSAVGAMLALAGTLISPQAQAEIGALDQVPAATLLLPYFEVDRSDPNGPQTRFTVINSSPVPTIAHAVLWTDMGVPTFAFDLYVGGRDSIEIDLRLLFNPGVLPQTSAAAFTAGPDSNAHSPNSTCAATATYPGFPVPNTVPGPMLTHIRLAHVGKPSAVFGNMCSAANHADNIERGYVTIDAVHACTSKFPSDPGYFAAGGTGIASDANVLFGTYTVIDRGNNVSTASPLVAIEASSTDPQTTIAGTYTFYAGYVGASAVDNRESLGSSVWHARTLDVGFFDPGSDLVVWRDPGFPHSSFVCGTTPSDFPRQEIGIIAFDEQEHPTIYNPGPIYPNLTPPPVYPVPLLAQRVPASSMSPYNSGFIILNLDGGFAGPSPIPGQSKSYVGVRHRLNGVFGAELPAVQNIDCASGGCYPF